MKTQNLIHELKRYGIRAAAYKRPPIGPDVFALTILPKHREGVVTVHQGTAQVQVHGNKKLRQATVTVNESPRGVTRPVRVSRSFKEEPSRRDAINVLKGNFPVIMPRRSAWSVKQVEMVMIPLRPDQVEHNKERADLKYDLINPTWTITGIVTAKVGKETVKPFPDWH